MASYKEIHGIKVQYRDSDATAVEGDVWYNATTGKLKMYSAVGAWASGNALNTGRDAMASIGIQTAAMGAAGYITDVQTVVEEYDGTSWTEKADVNTARRLPGGAGTTTAGMIFGGLIPPPADLGVTETWNGTSWTEVADLNTGRYMGGGSGIQTSFLCYGGATPSPTVNTEDWDGVSWTEVANLSTARNGLAYGSQGTTASCLATGGSNPGPTYHVNTEEFTKPQNVQIITD